MNVGSYLELYTTMYGWSIFDTLFNVFSMTGIIYLPFLLIVFRNWRDPFLSQDNKPAALTSERRMRYTMVSALLVYWLAVMPWHTVQLNNLHYTTACTASSATTTSGNSVTGGSTSTTYDQLTTNDVKIPYLWWLAMTVSAGVSYTVAGSFSCFDDLVGVDQQLRNLTIHDPILKNEYIRFANECFLPAKTKYLDALKGDTYQAYVKTALTNFTTNYPKLDTGVDQFYIGSHFYLTTDGFYKSMDHATCNTTTSGCSFQAQKPVAGWAWSASRDSYSNTLPGSPNCDEWWTDSSLGIRPRLLKEIKASSYMLNLPAAFKTLPLSDYISAVITHYFGITAFTTEQVEDLIISRYVNGDPPPMMADGGSYISNTSLSASATAAATPAGGSLSTIAGFGSLGQRIVTGAAADGGIEVAAIGAGKIALDVASTFASFYTTMFIAKAAAPMIQAVLLMMIYGLLIVYLVIGEYDVEKVILALFLIVGLRFLTPLWAVADYLHSKLFAAMYPNVTMWGSVVTFDYKRLLLDGVLSVLYLVAPAVLLTMVGMAGANIGGIGGASGEMSSNLKGVGPRLGGIPGREAATRLERWHGSRKSASSKKT